MSTFLNFKTYIRRNYYINVKFWSYNATAYIIALFKK